MQIDYPLVTAIVNTHPGCYHTLARALDSVLTQTYKGFELIIVDDSGQEPSQELMAILDKYDLLFNAAGIEGRYLATEEMFGSQAGPKNWALYHSRGEYIAYLDGDNEWEPRHLECLVTAIREGEVWPDFVYGRRRYMRDEGAPEKSGETILGEGDSPLQEWTQEAVARLGSSPMNNFIDSSDFLIARGAMYNKIHNTGWAWNEKHRRFGDWILMAEGVYYSGWRGKAVDEILSTYHWHPQQISLTRPAQEGVGMDTIK